MKAIGSVQHLKNKFLGGYTVHISIQNKASTQDIDRIEGHILQEILPQGTKLSERHGRFLSFDILHVEASSLSSLFQSMQTLKQNDEFLIDNYSISQCTLEQVFMKLVNSDE